MCCASLTMHDVAEMANELHGLRNGSMPHTPRYQLFGELLEFLEARTELAVLQASDRHDDAQLALDGVA